MLSSCFFVHPVGTDLNDSRIRCVTSNVQHNEGVKCSIRIIERSYSVAHSIPDPSLFSPHSLPVHTQLSGIRGCVRVFVLPQRSRSFSFTKLHTLGLVSAKRDQSMATTARGYPTLIPTQPVANTTCGEHRRWRTPQPTNPLACMNTTRGEHHQWLNR